MSARARLAAHGGGMNRSLARDDWSVSSYPRAARPIASRRAAVNDRGVRGRGTRRVSMPSPEFLRLTWIAFTDMLRRESSGSARGPTSDVVEGTTIAQPLGVTTTHPTRCSPQHDGDVSRCLGAGRTAMEHCCSIVVADRSAHCIPTGAVRRIQSLPPTYMSAPGRSPSLRAAKGYHHRI